MRVSLPERQGRYPRRCWPSRRRPEKAGMWWWCCRMNWVSGSRACRPGPGSRLRSSLPWPLSASRSSQETLSTSFLTPQRQAQRVRLPAWCRPRQASQQRPSHKIFLPFTSKSVKALFISSTTPLPGLAAGTAVHWRSIGACEPASQLGSLLTCPCKTRRCSRFRQSGFWPRMRVSSWPSP